MTLTTHGILGAATASFFPGFYPLAWAASFLSHFFADAIPHWDSQTQSAKKNLNPLANDFIITRESLGDMIKIGLDFGLGLVLPRLIFSLPEYDLWLILGGAFFAILPDPLQFVYWKIRREPLTSLQRFHLGIHAKIRIKDWRIGAPIQIIIIAFTVFITFQIHEVLKILTPLS